MRPQLLNEELTFSMNYSKLTAIAALATTILAGSMTAAINDQNRLPQRGLDPTIIEILQRAEAGTLPERFKPKTRKLSLIHI